MENVPEVVVLQVRVAQASICARAARGNIVINPEGKIRAKTARADNREGIGHKQIGAGNIVSGLHGLGLIGIEIKIALVTERDWDCPRDLSRIDCFRKRFFLGLRTQHDWILLDEYFVILWKLKAVLLEGRSEIIQFWIVIVAGRAGGLIFP